MACIVIYSALFIAGSFEGVRSVLLPVMQSDLNINHSILGFLLFASFTGFMVSALVNGAASDVLTDKPVITVGFGIFAIALLFFPLVRSFPFLVFTYFFARFGMGAIDITASSQGTRLFSKNAAIQINLLHLMFAVGAAVAPIVGSRLLEIGMQWRMILFFFFIPCAVFAVISIFTNFAEQSPRPMKEWKQEFRSVIKSRNLWILGALLAVAIIGEVNFIDWIKNYSIQIGGLDNIRSGNLIGLFYFTLMIGRLVGGFLAQKIGIMRFYLLYICGTFITFLLAVLLPFQIVFFVAVGWFVSPLFPIVTLMAAKVFPEQKGSAIGLIFAIGGLLGTFNSFLIGVMHDLFGTRIGFSLIAVGIFVGIPLVLYAQRRFGEQVA